MEPYEPSFIEAYKASPFFISIAFMVGATGFVLTVIALILVLKKAQIGVLLAAGAAVCGLLAIGAGTIGMFHARGLTYEAVATPGLSAHDRERILDAGFKESLFHLYAGLGAGLIPVIGGAMLLIVGRSPRK